MVSPPFASFSQNGEDVVLWRALHHVIAGRYVDVGAKHPEHFSDTMAFYQRDWAGITVEADPELARLQRDQRPRDWLTEAVVSSKDHGSATFHIVEGTGLSTLHAGVARSHASAGFKTREIDVASRRLGCILEEAGWEGIDIHFMCVHTEGSEREALESVDLNVWRPWVLLVRATYPLTGELTKQWWEDLVLAADYQFCLFDGLSCFYVASEHADELRAALSYPACPLDNYTRPESRELAELAESVPDLVDQVSRWRTQAVTRWSTAVAADTELDRVKAELEEVRLAKLESERDGRELRRYIQALLGSTSWRVTKPLRLIGRVRERPPAEM